MTEPITSLPAAVAALGALPVPAGPDRLTPEREAEITARADAATKGPWGLYEEATGHQHIAAGLEETGHGYRCRRGIAQLDPEPIDNDLAHRDWSEAEDREQVRIDAEFAAHAREDVPALLAELDAVRAERDVYRERALDAENRSLIDGREVCADCGRPVPDGPCGVHSPDAVYQRACQEAARLRAERDQARAALRDAANQVAELEHELAGAVIVSNALNRRLSEEQLAGSALYAALTMPTTHEQRQAALEKFTAVAQQVSGGTR